MKKKGFTLVELLAVIVIFAIILAIAIPSITGLVNNATRNAFESDAKMVLKSLDYALLSDDTFDVTTINEHNIESVLGISNINYDSVNITVIEGIPNILIVGKNRWMGLTAYGSFHNINIVHSDEFDATRPIISIVGSGNVTNEAGSPYVDAGATAYDNKDGDITWKINTTSNVNSNAVGTYYVTYNVEDEAGNTAFPVTRTVNVVDTTPPLITVLGTSPVVITQGTAYSDAGATAFDIVDGDLTQNIVVVNPVNVNIVGTYTLTYNVSDSAGNHAIQRTRTVNVVSPTTNFNFTGGTQSWTVPFGGRYKLEVWGAQGGNTGGRGGYAYGEINLSSGQQLTIIVGGAGSDYHGGPAGRFTGGGAGGGGGGSFIFSGVNILIAGGGGGGAAQAAGGNGGGTSGANGTNYGETTAGLGGSQSAGGGGGYSPNNDRGNPGGYGFGGGSKRTGDGSPFSTGGSGGGAGGFGGGGAAALNYSDGTTGGGGGGGYYGGGAGGSYYTSSGGGGGSSYTTGLMLPGTVAGQRTGHGMITITYIP